MDKKYIMSIDQGTTGTRVALFDHSGKEVESHYKEIRQYFPRPGWVEHDPLEIIGSVHGCIKEVFKKSGLEPKQIEAIGITNQRETVILWDRQTGVPFYNAIVWQCRRTSEYCEELKKKGFGETVRKKTGLLIDAYFSASKIRWIIDNVSPVKEKILKGQVCMGNVDSWIIWNLSNGKYHVTDYSNASRTMLFNIHTLEWDKELLEIFGIDAGILPEVKPTSGVMAFTGKSGKLVESIPVAGVAGDQQAALFGQGCFKAGTAKNTYGTALALIMNTGSRPVMSQNGLTTDLLWVFKKNSSGLEASYGLEGVIFIGGAAIQWLRDGLKIIKSSQDCSLFAERVPDTGGVYIVPAFTGLSAPYWDMFARGLIIGITRGTTGEHICRAALEAIAYQTKDVLESMITDSSSKIDFLRVDGGATKSDFLMQFQADILGIPLEKPKITEMTALGAAYLAGIGTGFWENVGDLEKHWHLEKRYEPAMEPGRVKKLYGDWKRAVERSFGWAR